MLVVNKKLWSFKFGCLIACSFLWLINVAKGVPVPEVLFPHPVFILDYYPGVVTGILAFISTLVVVAVMNKVFGICTSEHTFWLILPSLSLVALTSISAFDVLSTLLLAELPSLVFLVMLAISCRMARQRIKSKAIMRG